MKWLKQPKTDKYSLVCGINICFERKQSNYCGIQIDLSKYCKIQT
jgi:hypothetical protein